MWGCDAEETDKEDPQTGEKIWIKAAQVPLVMDGENVWRCPRRPIKDDPKYWEKLLFHYQLFRDGYLTDGGSIMDQSFKAITLFGAVQDIQSEADRQKAENEAVRRAMRGG